MIHRIFCNNNGEPKKLSKEYKAVCPFSHCCIPDIVLQSVFKLREQDSNKYYLHIPLDECMYTEKKPEKSSTKRNLIVITNGE